MKKLLEFIINKIIKDAKDIEIEEIVEDGNYNSYIIKAPKEKIGSIVGKNGRIIQAIRNVLKILAVKNNIFIREIKIQENNF